ncbi:MAG: hypothetical protein HOV80_20235 [Polyangiaceae bacterium]|nr:hypothetical protein [Polyangiaceae bacterium]
MRFSASTILVLGFVVACTAGAPSPEATPPRAAPPPRVEAVDQQPHVSASATATAAPTGSSTAAEEPKPKLQTEGLCITVRSGDARQYVYRRGSDVVTLSLERGDDADGIRFGGKAIEAAFADPNAFEKSATLRDLKKPRQCEIVHHRLDEAVRVVESAEVSERLSRQVSGASYDKRGRKVAGDGKELSYSGSDKNGFVRRRVIPVLVSGAGIEIRAMVPLGYVKLLEDARQPFTGTRTVTVTDADGLKSKDVERFDAKGHLVSATSFGRNLDFKLEEETRTRWKWAGDDATEMVLSAQAPGESADLSVLFTWSDGKLLRVEEQWTETKGGKTKQGEAHRVADLAYDESGRLISFNQITFDYAPAWDSCASIVW